MLLGEQGESRQEYDKARMFFHCIEVGSAVEALKR